MCNDPLARFTHTVYKDGEMNLKDFISSVGDAKAARLFGVEERTAASWRRGERTPRPKHVERIVKKSPVTYEGIYGRAE